MATLYEEQDDTLWQDDQGGQLKPKTGNNLPVWGNPRTMNLNHLVLTNIQNSSYFKVRLFELKTYHEVVDEIYYKVCFFDYYCQNFFKSFLVVLFIPVYSFFQLFLMFFL